MPTGADVDTLIGCRRGLQSVSEPMSRVKLLPRSEVSGDMPRTQLMNDQATEAVLRSWLDQHLSAVSHVLLQLTWISKI